LKHLLVQELTNILEYEHVIQRESQLCILKSGPICQLLNLKLCHFNLLRPSNYTANGGRVAGKVDRKFQILRTKDEFLYRHDPIYDEKSHDPPFLAL